MRQYAVLRIVFGFLATWYFLERLPFAWLYLFSGGWLKDSLMNEGFSTLLRLPVVFQYWPSLLGLFLIFIVSSTLWMLGWWSRTTGVLTWFGLLLIENQNPLLGFPGAELLKLIILPLLFAPTGGQWSLDAWFYKYKAERQSSALPLALIRVQVLMIFVLSGYSKLQGQYWADGEALVYMLLNPTLSRIPPVIIADYSWFFFPLSGVVSRFWIFFEIVFPFLMLAPILRRTISNVASTLILISLLLFKLSWLPLGLISLLMAFFSVTELREIEKSVIAFSKKERTGFRKLQFANPVHTLRSWALRNEVSSKRLQDGLTVENAATELSPVLPKEREP